MSEYHTPVLLHESIAALVTNPSGIYADVTFGGGGHTAELLSRLNEDGHVIAFDRDGDAFINNKIDDPRLTLVHGDFRFIRNYVLQAVHDGMLASAELDGVLADLGVSSHQFDTAERGFSFRYDAPLDMRMNQEGDLTAEEVVNEYSQEELERIFRIYGEVPNARKLSQLIAAARAKSHISTTAQLTGAMEPALPKAATHKFLAKIYQALRIEVNHEIDALKRLLEQSLDVLKPGGRLVVITYHSLEDRLVKNYMRAGNIEGKVDKDFYGRVSTPWQLVNNKVIVPGAQEVERNPRSRSAKLRIACKKAAAGN